MDVADCGKHVGARFKIVTAHPLGMTLVPRGHNLEHSNSLHLHAICWPLMEVLAPLSRERTNDWTDDCKLQLAINCAVYRHMLANFLSLTNKEL